MSIAIECVQCGFKSSVNDRMAGRRVRCPECQTVISVASEMETVQPLWPQDGEGETEANAPDLAEDSLTPIEALEDDSLSQVVEPIDNVEDVDPSSDVQSMTPVGSTVGSTPVSDSVAAGSIATAAHANAPTGPLEAEVVPQAVEPSSGPLILDDDDDEEPVLPRGKRPEEEMDMTPMVDVTFLLLIFFMVTAAFSLQKSIKMPRQQSDAPSMNTIDDPPDQLEQVELQIDEYGSFLVMAPEWEREVPGKQNLVATLREAIAGNKDGMDLIIKVHEQAKLNALVDAMDSGTIAGYATLQVTQVDGFD